MPDIGRGLILFGCQAVASLSLGLILVSRLSLFLQINLIMAQARYYYNSKNSPLQAVDETIVSKIISLYKEGSSITVIKESFPDVKITNNIHLFLPYEVTNEICSCGVSGL
jgi:hypothetical protein